MCIPVSDICVKTFESRLYGSQYMCVFVCLPNVVETPPIFGTGPSGPDQLCRHVPLCVIHGTLVLNLPSVDVVEKLGSPYMYDQRQHFTCIHDIFIHACPGCASFANSLRPTVDFMKPRKCSGHTVSWGAVTVGMEDTSQPFTCV